MIRLLYFIFFLLLFSISSCNRGRDDKNIHVVDTDSLVTIVEEDTIEKIDVDKIIDENIKESESFFYTQDIDSAEFVRLKDKFEVQQPACVAMADFDSVCLILDDIVIFSDDMQGVESINFRNGMSLLLPYQDEIAFVAYYPEFDILRLEGGHSMDIAYNLTTGDSIENTGLPPYMKFSPNREFLFNGYYGGQSYSFFIQHKNGANYQTLGYLDWGYDYIRDYFWINDSTLCIDVPDLDRFLLLTIKNEYKE